MNSVKLISDSKGYQMIWEDKFSIYIKDEAGHKVTPESHSWIHQFLGVKRKDKGYEILLRFHDGRFAKWFVDELGVRKKYESLEGKSVFEIANEFQLELSALSPRIYEEIKHNNLAKVYYKKAKICTQSGQHEKAEYYYYMATALATDNDRYIQELATCLSIQKKFKKALEAYLVLAAKYPKRNLDVWHFKHRILSYFKETKEKEVIDEAVKIFERIICISESRFSALDLLGDLYWERKDKDKAIEKKVLSAIEKAIDSKNIDILFPKPFTFTKDRLRLPDFLVIGPQKSGTTALYKYITDHPQVCPSSNKEIFFFDLKYHFDLDWYRSHFPVLPDINYLTGEASATYFNSQVAAERIAEVIPDIKLIFILRDPVDRAISDYYMKVRDGQDKRSIEEAIFSEIDYLSKPSVNFVDPDQDFFLNHRGYVRHGLYFYFMKVYFNYFCQENIYIVNSQNLLDFPRETMKQIFKFLKIDDFVGAYPVVNSGQYDRKIEDKILERLSIFFNSHNQLLENLTGIKFGWK